MKTRTQIIIFFTVVFLLVSASWHYVTAQGIPEFKIKKGWTYMFTSNEKVHNDPLCHEYVEKSAYVSDIKNGKVYFSYWYGNIIDHSLVYVYKYDSFVQMVTSKNTTK